MTSFLDHVNSINENIKFTVDIDSNNTLPYLDLLIKKNPDNG